MGALKVGEGGRLAGDATVTRYSGPLRDGIADRGHCVGLCCESILLR